MGIDATERGGASLILGALPMPVLLIGAQDDVTAAFKAAGWVQVDRTVTDTILTGALATFSKEAYLTMPMSILYLFDRPQDYGFAHAEPVKVVESRNHLRASALSVGRAFSKSTRSRASRCFALNSSTISGARYGSPHSG